MVPGVLGLKCMLSLIIILNVNKMGKDETTFNLKKLEDGIKKLKEQKKLPENFKLKGICKIFAWGEMTALRDGIKQDLVVYWHPTGIGWVGKKGDTRDQLILDDDDNIILGQAQLVDWKKELYIGDLRIHYNYKK